MIRARSCIFALVFVTCFSSTLAWAAAPVAAKRRPRLPEICRDQDIKDLAGPYLAYFNFRKIVPKPLFEANQDEALVVETPQVKCVAIAKTKHTRRKREVLARRFKIVSANRSILRKDRILLYIADDPTVDQIICTGTDGDGEKGLQIGALMDAIGPYSWFPYRFLTPEQCDVPIKANLVDMDPLQEALATLEPAEGAARAGEASDYVRDPQAEAILQEFGIGGSGDGSDDSRDATGAN